MPYFYKEVEIDIDISDFYDEMSDRDKEEMIQLLRDDEYLISSDILTYELQSNFNLIEWEFKDIIDKIAANRLLLTSEEDEMLKKIASRF